MTDEQDLAKSLLELSKHGNVLLSFDPQIRKTHLSISMGDRGYWVDWFDYEINYDMSPNGTMVGQSPEWERLKLTSSAALLLEQVIRIKKANE